jgi:hypothetical protein
MLIYNSIGAVQVISIPHVSLYKTYQHEHRQRARDTHCSPMAVSVSSAMRILSVEPLIDGCPDQVAILSPLILEGMNLYTSLSSSSDN